MMGSLATSRAGFLVIINQRLDPKFSPESERRYNSVRAIAVLLTLKIMDPGIRQNDCLSIDTNYIDFFSVLVLPSNYIPVC